MRPWALLQHVAWEGPGLIAPAAHEHGISLDVRRLDLGAAVPAPDALPGFGGLVVMGGPMSVWEEAAFPFLGDEKLLLRAAVAAGTPVLGVCLGAQLLAAALGARLERGPAPEVGAGEVELTAAGRRDPVIGPGPVLPVLHWHGDTFTLPEGAVHLARSAAYAHQAFRVGACAYGLQFHVEVDEELAAAWAAHLPPGVTIDREHRHEVEHAGRSLLGRFFATATARRQGGQGGTQS